MGVQERLAELGGCARRRSIANGSRDVAALRALVECGAGTRPARGLYVIPGTSAAVVAARRASAQLTCATAAGLLGLPLLDPPTGLHLALGGHSRAPRLGVVPAGSVLHWDSGLRRAVLRQADGGEGAVLAPVPIVLAHAIRCLPPREAIALIDSALNRGLVSLGDLVAHRPRAERVTFDQLVRATDGRSQSLPETFARLSLRSAGLQVVPQVLLAGVGHVDLLVEDLAVVELDGFSYHGDRRQFREDRRRDRVLALRGVPVLRFTYEDAVFYSSRLVNEVTSLVLKLQRAGRQPVDRSRRDGAWDW